MNFVKNEEGQGLVEYALILALIAVVCILIMSALGRKTGTIFGSVNATLDQANASSGTVANYGKSQTGNY